MALEAEMTRLNDAGMDGANRHLVNLFAFNSIKVRDTGMVSDGLQPGMSFGAKAELFRDFTFENVHLRAVGRERRKAVRYLRAANPQKRMSRIGDDRVKLDFFGRFPSVAKKGRDPLAVG